MNRGQVTCGELTYAEVAEAVERAFGRGSVGAGEGPGSAEATDAARAAFARACILLVVKQRCEAAGIDRKEQAGRYFEVNRAVRLGIAAFLGVDENEVFRLHHHAAGRRAEDSGYRRKCQDLERAVAKAHGMEI